MVKYENIKDSIEAIKIIKLNSKLFLIMSCNPKKLAPAKAGIDK